MTHLTYSTTGSVKRPRRRTGEMPVHLIRGVNAMGKQTAASIKIAIAMKGLRYGKFE